MRQRNQAYLLFPVFLLLALGLFPGCEKKTELKLRLPAGSEYRMRMETNMSQTLSVQGFNVDMPASLKIAMDFKVLSVAEDGAMTLHFTCVERQDDPGLSALPMIPRGVIDAMTSAPKAMVGTEFTAVITPQGKVTSIEGLAAAQQKALAALKQQGQERVMTETTVRGYFRESYLRSLVEAAFDCYPAQPVLLNETWTATKDAEDLGGAGIPVKMDLSFTLKQLEADRATIAATAKFSPAAQATAAGPFSYSSSGDGTGEYEVELATGLPVKQKTEQQLTGQMRFGAGEAAGLSIDFKQKGISLTEIWAK